MYSGNSPPDIQSEMSWSRGEIMAPRRGIMFGCVSRFHIMTSSQKVYDFCERWQSGKVAGLATHFRGLFRRILGGYPDPFDTDP